jgi:molecular chaperone GrpE
MKVVAQKNQYTIHSNCFPSMRGAPVEVSSVVIMKKTLRKIFDMKEKDPEQHEQEQPESQSGQPTNDSVEESANVPADKVQELQQQLEEAKNKFLYLFSDFENYKRNAAKERMDLISGAGREILSALLPVLDDFDRAHKNGALSEGTTLIHQKLANIVRSKGLAIMETKAGDTFDADRHEAIAEIPAPTEALKGKIVDVTEQGYMLGERIIRFAKVVVGK